MARNMHQRQAPRPLPVLRTTDELPVHMAVLSEGPPYLARMVEPAYTGTDADVGPIRCNPTSVSAVATADHTRLGGNGEARLKNPLRKICTAGSVRGETRSGLLYSERERNHQRLVTFVPYSSSNQQG
jgi:hypothetical protein